jgi:hypothetical protein
VDFVDARGSRRLLEFKKSTLTPFRGAAPPGAVFSRRQGNGRMSASANTGHSAKGGDAPIVAIPSSARVQTDAELTSFYGIRG